MGSFYNYDLKNEDDVKEYLKNLLIEYNFGCFSEKKGDGKLISTFVMAFW